MKKLTYIIGLIFLVAGCSGEAPVCFKSTGKMVEKEVNVESFDRVLVNRDISLVISQGNAYKVRIETGKNLLNDIEVKLVDNRLHLTDNNICNFVRDYGVTKIYLTTPDLKEIRSSTQYDIISNGILNFNNLTLISEDYIEKETFTVGDFRLEVNTNKLSVVTNNISSQFISGQTDELYVGYFAGNGRFEGANLIAQHVEISHRGSNDMIVNPQQSMVFYGEQGI